MARPPTNQDEPTRTGHDAAEEDANRRARLDAALGLAPLDDEPTAVGEARLGSGLRPPTSETRRPTDRGIVPPPLPRPLAAPPESEPVAPRPPSSHAAPASALTRPGMPAFVPAGEDGAPPHVRSSLLKKRVTAETTRATPPPPPLSRPTARPLIRPGREPRSLVGNVSELLSKPIVRPSGKNLAPPAQREATDPAHGPTPDTVMRREPTAPRVTPASEAPPAPTEPEVDPQGASPLAPLPWAAHPTSEVVEAEPLPWRREDSDPAFHLPGRLLAKPLPERTRTATAARPRVTTGTRLVPRLSLATLALLVVAAALPSRAGAPWELALRPADPTFVALMAALLVGVVHLVPVGPRTRSALSLAVATIVLALGLALLSHEVAVAFDGQPALLVLFSGSPAIGIALVLAATLVPAGLFLRRLAPRHMAATGLVGFGAALVLAVAFDVGGIFPDTPVLLLVQGVTEASFLGDRVAAAAALPALVLLAGCLAFTFPGLGRAIAAPIGILVWGLAFAPGIVLATFVATSSDWLAVLGPVKLVVLVGAAALYLASGLASIMLPAAGAAPGHVTRTSPDLRAS